MIWSAVLVQMNGVCINPFTYAAGYTDTTGYIKYGARYYNPTTGRFAQPDPSHQEINNYAYAKDDPINGSDTNGLFDWGATIGGLIGGAVGSLATALCPPAARQRRPSELQRVRVSAPSSAA
ncbi:MAG: hypothetical protein M3N95_18815 [Actinomycetota bacterium]|nr:hypothetical protein [Actinomycetota bacterium]